MRITNGMMVNNMMTNMYSNLGRLNNVNNQYSSGKQFTLPSENPIGVSKSMRYHTDLAKLDQYKTNLGDAVSWMAITEDTITQMNSMFKRVRDLALQAASETNTTKELQAIAPEIEQNRQQLIKAANATYAGRSIFTGFKTDVPLLDEKGNYKLTNYKTELAREIKGANIDASTLDFAAKPVTFEVQFGPNKTTITLDGTKGPANDGKFPTMADLQTEINAQLAAGTPAATGLTVNLANVVGSSGQLVFNAPAAATPPALPFDHEKYSILIEKPSTGDLASLGLTDGRFPLKSSEKALYTLGVADDIDVNNVGIGIFGKATFDENGKLIEEPNYLAESVNGYSIADKDDDKIANEQYSDKSYMLAVVDEFYAALQSGDRETVQKTIKRIDGIQQNLLQVQAEIGAKTRRLELTESRMKDENINFTKLMSENEDADMMDVFMRLKIEENIYQSSLAAGAKVIQPTLLDFLR